jgi:hypothetical protein
MPLSTSRDANAIQPTERESVTTCTTRHPAPPPAINQKTDAHDDGEAGKVNARSSSSMITRRQWIRARQHPRWPPSPEVLV